MTTTFIQDKDFDNQFQRTLTAAVKGSADLGEAFAVADKIVSGDLGSWATEWAAKADEVLACADRSLARGDVVSARGAYLRASEYYRQSFFYARADLDDLRLRSGYPAHVNACRAAIRLFPWDSTIVDVDQGEIALRGYLLRPDNSGTPRPTVIALAGYDSTAENGYVLAAAAALERGMNCLTFEGPGQGGVLFERRLTMRHDFEAVLTPAIDWLLTQDGVDPEVLILLGRSFAGYLAPRGATKDRRLAALICDPAQYDFAAPVRSRLGKDRWERLQAADPTLEAELQSLLLTDPVSANGFQWRMTAHGVSTLTDYFAELSRFTLVGLADQITCPVLALAGEGDFAGTGQLSTFAAALTAPVTTHQFTIAEGAGGHCEGIGQDRFEQYSYGWLAQIGSARIAGRQPASVSSSQS